MGLEQFDIIYLIVNLSKLYTLLFNISMSRNLSSENNLTDMQKYMGKTFIGSAYPRYLSERALMVYRESSSSSPILLSPLLPVSRHDSEREG